MTAFPHHPFNHGFIPEGGDPVYAYAGPSTRALRKMQAETQAAMSRWRERPTGPPLRPELNVYWVPQLPGACSRLRRSKAQNLRIEVPGSHYEDADSDSEAQIIRALKRCPLFRFYCRTDPKQSLCCIVLLSFCFAFVCTLPFALRD